MHCCQAFKILRQSSNLILNFFLLMADAGIPDLQGDIEKNLLKVSILHSFHMCCLSFPFCHLFPFALFLALLFLLFSFAILFRSKRSSVWIWVMMMQSSFSCSWFSNRSMHCFLLWLNNFTAGQSTGGEKISGQAHHNLSDLRNRCLQHRINFFLIHSFFLLLLLPRQQRCRGS